MHYHARYGTLQDLYEAIYLTSFYLLRIVTRREGAHSPYTPHHVLQEFGTPMKQCTPLHVLLQLTHGAAVLYLSSILELTAVVCTISDQNTRSMEFVALPHAQVMLSTGKEKNVLTKAYVLF